MRILNRLSVKTTADTARRVAAGVPPQESLQLKSLNTQVLNLVAREEVDVPISPSPIPTDTLLYQDPHDPVKKYYLPRYELVTEEVSGDNRYRIDLSDDQDAWVLTVVLNRFMPPELERLASSATELDHSLSAIFKYTTAQGQQSRKFNEIEQLENGARISMRLPTITERDAIFQAMTDTDLGSAVVVSRAIRVAVEKKIAKPPSQTPAITFAVQLQSVANKIQAIKVVRQWTGLGLSESKGLVEQQMPAIILKGQPEVRAAACVRDFSLAGAVAKSLQERSVIRPRPRPRPDRFNVSLTKIGNSKAKLLTLLMKFAGLTTEQGKRIIASRLPRLVIKGADVRVAKRFRSELQKIGAQVTIKPLETRSQISRQAVADGSFSANALVAPELEFLGSRDIKIRGKSFVQYVIAVANATQIPAELFTPAPDLPPCGQNQNSSRTWVDVLDQNGKRLYGYCNFSSPENLAKFAFNLKQGAAVPTKLQIVLNDRRRGNKTASNRVNLSAEPDQQIGFELVSVNLDQNIAPTPFVFDSRLHAYIYQILGAPRSSELIHRQLVWKGQFYTYLIDARQRHIVYFLPDEFRVGRWDRPPLNPRMSVSIRSRDDGTDHADVTLSYLAVPVVDRSRLDDASATLANELQAGDPDIDMQPYPVMDYTFRISYPTETGIHNAEQSVAANVFYQGIQNTLIMPLPDFGACYAAMTGQTAASFHGIVSVTLPDDERVDLPFKADLANLAGDLFDCVALEDDSGEVSITLINAIESALDIQALKVSLARGEDQPTDATIVVDPALPITLESGQSISINANPVNQINGDEPIKAIFDTSGVEVVLDEEAVWNSIIDRTTTEYFRLITVKAVPNIFQAVAGREEEQIIAVLVHFEGGETVELNRDTLVASARVDYSVDDLILRRAVSSNYRYSYEIARVSGQVEQLEGEERRHEEFFVSVVR